MTFLTPSSKTDNMNSYIAVQGQDAREHPYILLQIMDEQGKCAGKLEYLCGNSMPNNFHNSPY